MTTGWPPPAGRPRRTSGWISSSRSTTRPRSRRRSLVQPGWRCLEVGAGRGSMAVWLAEQVGPDRPRGRDRRRHALPVAARAPEPRGRGAQHPRRPARRARAGSFDLVCSRLMLFHLQGRQERGDRADGRVPATGWLAPRRGRRLGERPELRSIPRTRATTTTSGCGRTATGGRFAATTRRSAGSCRRCSSAVGSRTSATRRRPRWCAEARPGRDGGSRPWRSSTSSAAATTRPGVRSR